MNRLDTMTADPSSSKRTETLMHLRHAILLAVLLTPTVVRPRSYKVEVLKEAPPRPSRVRSGGC